MSYVDRVLDDLKARYKDQPEFLQTAEEVLDSLCVPQYNKDGEERVILFLKMASGHTFRPDLVKRIREAIRLGLSARHVPSLILETQGIPVGPPKSSPASVALS